MCAKCERLSRRIQLDQAQLDVLRRLHAESPTAPRIESQAKRVIAAVCALQPGEWIDFEPAIAPYERLANYTTRARRCCDFPLVCLWKEDIRMTRILRPLPRSDTM